jgi:hypothetical protein
MVAMTPVPAQCLLPPVAPSPRTPIEIINENAVRYPDAADA